MSRVFALNRFASSKWRTSAGESCVGIFVDEDLHVEHISRLDLPPKKDEKDEEN
jgi:hypothetical protein